MDAGINSDWQHISARVTKEQLFCERCPDRPYVSLCVQDENQDTRSRKLAVRRVLFTTTSHDQGFSDEPENHGTYHASHTWFEARVVQQSGHERVPRKHVQFNVHSSSEAKTHKNCWDTHATGESPDNDESGAAPHDFAESEWLSGIRQGDFIELMPKALYASWTNTVLEASIDVWIEWTVETSASILDSNCGSIYRELNSNRREIRIVVLEPQISSSDDAIQLSLIHVDLDDSEHPSYEALSYCWGDEAATSTVRLSHGTGFTDAPLNQNVTQALRRLRRTDTPRLLWVDLFCINQADSDERGQQVAMMAEIYKASAGVCIWLGPTDAQSHANALGLHRLARRLETGIKMEIEEIYTFAAQDGIFLKPWFQRVWVLQEAWNAPKGTRPAELQGNSIEVLYGGQSLTWNDVMHANKFFENNYGHSRNTHVPPVWNKIFDISTVSPSADVHPATQLRCLPVPRLEILEIVIGALDMKATDARDKIFAMLSFGAETHRVAELDSLITPNYSKSVAQVFADFTRWWIMKHRTLRILSAVHTLTGRSWLQLYGSNLYPYQERDGSLQPSWTLWSGGRQHLAKGTLAVQDACEYNACGERKVDVALLKTNDSMHWGTLRLRGVRLGRIRSFHPFPFLASSGLPQQAHKDLQRAYLKIANAGVWETSKVLDQDHASVELGHFMVHGMRSWLPCHGKSLFLTDNGLIGLCPAPARIGDIAVILYGGRIPYLVRELGWTTDLEFVGECYVHGFMYGEAFEENGRITGEEQEFALR